MLRPEEPLDVILDPYINLSVSFVPHKSGEYFVNELRDGHHITGSPFAVDVDHEKVLGTDGWELYEKLHRIQVIGVKSFSGIIRLLLLLLSSSLLLLLLLISLVQ